jgi:hypothetical protein
MVTTTTLLVMDAIEEIGLLGLSDVLQETNTFIAGSYSIPIQHLIVGGGLEDDDRDIDIWMMHEADGLRQAERLSILTDFLVNAGYQWPQSIGVKQFEGEASHYKRMERSIRTIYVFRHQTFSKPPIQILLLHESAGSTPEEIVRNFDFTLMLRWYDGKEVIILEEAAQALEDRVLKINISKDFERQNMHEWIRTAKRMQKYKARNFKLEWQSERLNILLLDAATEIYQTDTRSLSLYLLERWNKEILTFEDGQVPYLGVTVCPPGTNLSHVRVFKTTNSRFFLNPDPLLFWNELTKKEQENMERISLQKHRIVNASVLSRDECSITTTKENVATLIKFPALKVLSSPPSRTTEVFVAVELQFVEETVYLGENPEDHIIIMTDNGDKFGLSRTYLKNYVKDFIVCPTPNSQDFENVRKSGFIAQISLSYTVYVPRSQVDMAIDSPYTTFGVSLVDKLKYDFTISKELLESDNPDLMSADHCQEGTDKSIYMLYAIK